MTFAHGKKAKLYVNGYDLSAYLTRISGPARVDVVDVSTLGDDDKEYIVGQTDATVHAEGFFDVDAATALAIDDVIEAAFGVDAAKVFTQLPQGDTQGAPAAGVEAHATSYEVQAALGDAVRVTVDAQSSVGREKLLIHHVRQVEAGAGQSSSINNGASSADGGVGYLQAVGAGPIAAVTAKIQHSADDAIWVDLITFTAFTDRTAERKTVTGTVNQYTRGRWEQASTIPFWLGFGRNPA